MATDEACSPQSSTTEETLLLGGGAASGTAGLGRSDDASPSSGADRAAGGDVERRPALVAVPVPLARTGWGYLVRELKDLSKSAAPTKVFCFEGGAWSHLPPPAVGALRDGFAAGRSVVEVPVGGSLCLFDFERMVQMDVATAAEKPVAWIDAHGRLFYPRMAAGGAPKRSDENGGAATAVGPLEEHWDENRVVSCPGGVDGSSWAGLQVLDERDKSYKIVEKIFLECMRRSAPATRITSIRKCPNGGASGISRLRAFQMWEQMIKAARGTANVRYGWYGAPASEVASVVAYGFGQPNNRAMRPEAQAVGVYVAPAHSPHASAAMSAPDHGGERYVVLCRVIMGNAEKVDLGTPQGHPSGDEFDSGVDNLEKPRWYIVWGTRMNTHILPEYVVSFKTAEAGPQVRKAPQQRTASRPRIPFPQLSAELGNSIPASRVHALETLFNHFKAGKLTKEVFLRNLRAIGGDNLLATIRRVHTRYLAATK